ncbi:MAG: phosphatidate cytidylyltransferase [Leptothrix sp. (in: b-proteobacteria)]
MLKQRVITAIVLMLVLLPALFAHAVWPFALLSLLMIGASGWEWSRLNGWPGSPALLVGALVAAVSALGFAFGWIGQVPVQLWWLAALVWVLGGALVLQRGVSAWPQTSQQLRLLGGVLLLWLAWLAIAEAKVRGLNFLLSVFCLVWAADIAAYFGGRAFGKRKLAPSISPGKSWAGVYSGMVGVLLLAVAWINYDLHGPTDSASLYTLLLQRWGAVGLLLGCLFLAAMSVVGDLFESLVKRSAGAKDSSALLPGHGGVLDRIDALLPVCPLALALVLS